MHCWEMTEYKYLTLITSLSCSANQHFIKRHAVVFLEDSTHVLLCLFVLMSPNSSVLHYQRVPEINKSCIRSGPWQENLHYNYFKIRGQSFFRFIQSRFFHSLYVKDGPKHGHVANPFMEYEFWPSKSTNLYRLYHPHYL